METKFIARPEVSFDEMLQSAKMLDVHSMITEIDRHQSGSNAILCPVKPDHGKMTANASGTALLCCHPSVNGSSIKLCAGMTVIGR